MCARKKKIQRTVIARLCEQEGNFSCHRIRAEAGLYNVSLWTINRTLKRMGYAFLEARKKGILLEKDFRERLRFARKVKRTYCNDFYMNDICFDLDGESFYRNLYNPLDDARAPKGKIWRKRKEELSVTAKGMHVGSCGRVVKMIVVISYPILLDGNYYADFICRNFKYRKKWSFISKAKVIFYLECDKICHVMTGYYVTCY